MEPYSEACRSISQERALPTGTVTFLFSDIEGSTARWEAHREAMVEQLRCHDAIMRRAITTCRGHVFKTVGDAFCAAFATASDAIAAATDAQRALIRADSSMDGLRVRMAIHTGSVDARDGDYFGPTVNLVARLLSVGHGGQTLVSGAAAELAQTALPAEVRLRDLGQHKLKDIDRRQHVYQLIAPDLIGDFPPLRSLDASPNNLPYQLTSFFGREAETTQIKDLLHRTRLVTLVGTGGIGKTRCALHVGAEMLHAYSQGVWLVELASVSDAQFVASTIATTIRAHELPDRPLTDAIISFLKNQSVLLILDNCEHVIEQVAALSDAIVRNCERVSILATSRESLGVAGETLYHVPSLSVPTFEDAPDAAQAMRYGAVALFVARARSMNDEFRLTDETASVVAHICRRLDGIALAIELAAAWIKILDVRELDNALDERFRVLTGGSRTALRRQQTMQALIDWSYALLSDPERTLFRRLAVFANGFTLDAGAAVSGEGSSKLEILDLLLALVDKSLVSVETERQEGRRYRLLESLREYGRERLNEHNEREDACRRFSTWCLGFAQSADEAWATSPSAAWESTVSPELENLRYALAWALEDRNDVLLGLRMVAASRRIWGRFAAAEGLRWVRTAIAMLDDAIPNNVEAALWLAEAQLNVALKHYKAALAAAERAAKHFISVGDELSQFEAHAFAGFALVLLGDCAQGAPMLADSLAVYRKCGAKQLAGHALEELAIANVYAGDFAAARQLFREALATFRDIDNQWGLANVAGNLAELEFRAGDRESAVQLATQAITGDPTDRDKCVYLSNLAAYLVALGRWQDARLRAGESLTHALVLRSDMDIIFALQHFAAIAALRPSENARGTDDLQRAAGLLGYVDARLKAMEGLREQTEQQEYDRAIVGLRAALGGACDRLAQEGSGWSEQRAITEARTV